MKYLIGQITALLSAQRTRVDDPRRGKCFDRCRNVGFAAFAGKDE
jgi:hypothetical protein